MTVIILERVTPGLRGKLTRWLVEIHAGVFVGKISPRVRDKLWKAVQCARRLGACTLAFHAPNEQGFVLATAGDASRTLVDFDGLQRLCRPAAEAESAPKAPAL